MSAWSSAFSRLIGWFAALGGASIVFMMFLVNIDVVGRHIRRPIPWGTEVSEFLIALFTFLGAAWLLEKEGHTTLDIVLNSFKPRVQALLKAIMSIVGAITCFIIAYYAVKVSVEYFQMGMTSHTMLDLPVYPRYVVLFIGFLLMAIQFLRRTGQQFHLWKTLSGKEKGTTGTTGTEISSKEVNP